MDMHIKTLDSRNVKQDANVGNANDKIALGTSSLVYLEWLSQAGGRYKVLLIHKKITYT